MASFSHKTITQGRKTIVFGMPWYWVDEEESPRKAGVALSKQVQSHFDLIVARKDVAPQFGLATSMEGAKSGSYSGAAIVADLVGVESWIYVLEIESSIWICCGRDGYILPAGDRVYENREEARRAFHDLNPPSFKKICLPASWKASGSNGKDLQGVASDIEETDVLDFIEYNPPKWGRLSSISSIGAVLKISMAAILLLSIAFGTWSVLTSKSTADMTPEERARLLAQQAALLAQKNSAEREKRWAVYDANRPWHSAAPSGKLLDSCLREIKKMPTRPVGYDVTDIHCNNGSVTASVERTTGYSTWLEEWAQSHPDIEAVANSTGDQGYLTRDITPIPSRGAEKIVSFEEISGKMLVVGQIEGSSVQLSTPAAAIIPDEPDYTPYYASGAYKITTARPEAWLKTFTTLPGITLNSVRFNSSNNIYTMEGEIYVPNL